MRIEKIAIKNFKVLRDVVVERIGGMAVFVGENGSGKSTIFEALGFLRDCIRTNTMAAVQSRGGMGMIHSKEQSGDIEISLDFRSQPDGPAITYELAIEDPNGEPVVHKERLFVTENGSIKEHMLLHKGTGHVTGIEGQSEAISLDEAYYLGVSSLGQQKKYRLLGDVRRYIDGFYIFDQNIQDVRRVSFNNFGTSFRTGGDIASITKYMRENHPEEYAFVRNKLRLFLPEFKQVDSIQYEDGALQVRFQDQRFETPFTAQQISDGVLKLYSYLLLLEDTNPPSLLCIDEPEIQVYPGSHGGLADEFRAYSMHHQIFITTHSPNLLNAVELPEAYFVKRQQDGFSTIRKVEDMPMVKRFYEGGDLLGVLWNEGHLEEGR